MDGAGADGYGTEFLGCVFHGELASAIDGLASGEGGHRGNENDALDAGAARHGEQVKGALDIRTVVGGFAESLEIVGRVDEGIRTAGHLRLATQNKALGATHGQCLDAARRKEPAKVSPQISTGSCDGDFHSRAARVAMRMALAMTVRVMFVEGMDGRQEASTRWTLPKPTGRPSVSDSNP